MLWVLALCCVSSSYKSWVCISVLVFTLESVVFFGKCLILFFTSCKMRWNLLDKSDQEVTSNQRRDDGSIHHQSSFGMCGCHIVRLSSPERRCPASFRTLPVLTRGVTQLCCPSCLQNLTPTPLKAQFKRSCKWPLVCPVLLAVACDLWPSSDCGLLDQHLMVWKKAVLSAESSALAAEHAPPRQPESRRSRWPRLVALSWKLKGSSVNRWPTGAFSALGLDSVLLKMLRQTCQYAGPKVIAGSTSHRKQFYHLEEIWWRCFFQFEVSLYS